MHHIASARPMSAAGAMTGAVLAYDAACADPAASDWRAVADLLRAALPAGRAKPADDDAATGPVPRWWADWKLGKVYSLDTLEVTFSDERIGCRLPRSAAALNRPAVILATRPISCHSGGRMQLDTQRRNVSRRYKYRDLITRHDLMDFMRERDLNVNKLARLACIGTERLDRTLKGLEGFDIPPALDQLVRLWDDVPGAYEKSVEWAKEKAYDVREGEPDAER